MLRKEHPKIEIISPILIFIPLEALSVSPSSVKIMSSMFVAAAVEACSNIL
jgi:hypothetical protein